MSEELSTTNVSSDAPPAVDVDEYRSILEQQVRILSQLNDELFRTLRLHILLGGGLLTVLSIIVSRKGTNVFGINQPVISDITGWGFSAALVAAFGLAWFFRLGSSRLSYTDLHLGSPTESSLPTFNVSKRDVGHFEAFSSFLREDIGIRTFEDHVERITHEDIPDTHSDILEHNNYILTTREVYVNTIQKYLYFSFLLFSLGILGIIIF